MPDRILRAIRSKYSVPAWVIVVGALLLNYGRPIWDTVEVIETLDFVTDKVPQVYSWLNTPAAGILALVVSAGSILWAFIKTEPITDTPKIKEAATPNLIIDIGSAVVEKNLTAKASAYL